MNEIPFLRPDVPARLEELRTLQDGWLEGGGVAPAPDGLDWLSQAFSENFPEDLRLPSLYPQPDGGIQAEWSLPPHEISIEINLTHRTAAWHRLNLDTEEEDAADIDLGTPEGWQGLAARLREIPGSLA